MNTASDRIYGMIGAGLLALGIATLTANAQDPQPVEVKPSADGQGVEVGIDLLAKRTLWQSYLRTWREHPVAMAAGHVAAAGTAFAAFEAWDASQDRDRTEEERPQQPTVAITDNAGTVIIIAGDGNAVEQSNTQGAVP
jgi:hypothetical protein